MPTMMNQSQDIWDIAGHLPGCNEHTFGQCFPDNLQLHEKLLRVPTTENGTHGQLGYFNQLSHPQNHFWNFKWIY